LWCCELGVDWTINKKRLICPVNVHKFAAPYEYFRRVRLSQRSRKNTRQTKTFIMKKTVLFAAALFTVSAVSAQTGEITSARGENWLSQDGDWGLTFDAQPLLNYAGNLFNGYTNGNTQTGVDTTFGPTFGQPIFSPFGGNNIGGGLTWANPSFAIQGKKLVDANTAYRGRLRIGFGSTKNTDIVLASPAPSPQTDPSTTVENVEKNGYMSIVIGAGLEKRVGSTRVVGVYGGDFNVGFGNSKSTYTYGNALTALNPEGQARRVTEVKNAGMFMLGLNAFAGVEWFAAPKISLSGEYTWGLALTSLGTPEVTTENWDTAAANGAGALVSRTTVGDATVGNVDKTSSFKLDTGVSGASIGINFYFQ
jgi:hypothetical protein